MVWLKLVTSKNKIFRLKSFKKYQKVSNEEKLKIVDIVNQLVKHKNVFTEILKNVTIFGNRVVFMMMDRETRFLSRYLPGSEKVREG